MLGKAPRLRQLTCAVLSRTALASEETFLEEAPGSVPKPIKPIENRENGDYISPY